MHSHFNYDSWKNEYNGLLEEFIDKGIYVLYSGGKDSSLALDLMSRASREYGFHFEAHGSPFPRHRYTDQERQRLESYWSDRGVQITWHDPGVGDDSIQADVNPCRSCRSVNKGLLKEVMTSAQESADGLVLVAGYSLWDIVSYSIEHILGSVYAASESDVGTQKNDRFLETAQRFYPVLQMANGNTVFRPLIRYNEGEIVRLLEEREIPVLSTPCRYKSFRPKRPLMNYYQDMDLSFDYDKVFEFAKKALDLPASSSYTDIPFGDFLVRLF